MLHPLARAGAQFSVPPAPPLSSHPRFPSSTTTCGATTCPPPPRKTLKRRTSSNGRDSRAIGGPCESFFSFFAILVIHIRSKEAPFNSPSQICESFFFFFSPPFLPSPSHRKPSGFSAVSQLFSERWPSAAANRSFGAPATERNIDFELDVRVEIDSGKCVLHPTTQQPEHEDVSLKKYDERLSSYSDNYCDDLRFLFF